MPGSDDEGSLFEQMMAEVHSPFEIDVDGDVWTVAAPDPDGVCDLDHRDPAADELAGLLGDVGDEVLDALDDLPRSATVDLLDRLRAHFHLPDLPAGTWLLLVEQIDRYGEALEADLLDRGVDLLDWFRGRRPWTQLARALRNMPQGCRYWAAVLDDEDLARRQLESGNDDGPRKRPQRAPLLGESPEMAILREILNATRRAAWSPIAAQAGKKAGKPPAAIKGPQTALDRVRAQASRAAAEDIFSAVTPGWRGDSSSDN